MQKMLVKMILTCEILLMVGQNQAMRSKKVRGHFCYIFSMVVEFLQ